MSSPSRHSAVSTETEHHPPRRPDRGRPARGSGLATLGVCSLIVMAVALGLVFFYAPLDAEQGFLQKIFYVHVPLAIVSLCGFIAGGIMAIAHLRTRDARWDMRSYVAIHVSLIFAVGTLITGSIWAKGSWGHWWVWSEPTLVSFLIVFLLYATYQPLRFAIEDPERQARYASVFAITAGAFVPLNFIAVRLSTAYLHPRVLGSTSNLPPQMALTFAVSLLGIALLYATLCAYELTAKRVRAQLRALRRRADLRSGAGEAAASPEHPALPLHEAGKYVAGAYVVLFALVLVYVVIMAVRLSRIEREVNELLTRASEPSDQAPEDGVDISGAGSTAA
jgi:heme exporter protein C